MVDQQQVLGVYDETVHVKYDLVEKTAEYSVSSRCSCLFRNTIVLTDEQHMLSVSLERLPDENHEGPSLMDFEYRACLGLFL